MESKAATWLKTERTSRNLSLRELARLTNLTHTTISDAERSKASPETWKTLAEFFKTPVNTVLTWAGFLEAIPTKDDLIDQIEGDLRLMSPEARKVAARLVRSLLEPQ